MADATHASIFGVDPSRDSLELDDGYVSHAPVGRFLANPFGLHDVIGNVFEWCRDGMGDYESTTPRPGDGLREPTPLVHRVFRGGSHGDAAGAGRSAVRFFTPPDYRGGNIGCRPARAVDP